ncbi:MAG: Protein GrpE [Chlamydiae bacterium]|nr:Protein GrpE [Chlamydiota bacterium]
MDKETTHEEFSDDKKENEELIQEEETPQEPELVTIDKAELEQLQASVKEHQDKYLRLLAESENLRKRLQKEKVDLQAYARENLICEFLAPIDQLENALSFRDGVSEEVKNWMVGFDMIVTQFKDVLSQNDIRPIEAVGRIFDPHYHEALETEENEEHPINTIIKEYVRGYQMGSRVIRPAKVKVSKRKSLESEKNQEVKKSNETINQKEG